MTIEASPPPQKKKDPGIPLISFPDELKLQMLS